MYAFDYGWQFAYGFENQVWTDVTLPHDASAMLALDSSDGFRPEGWMSANQSSGYAPYGKCAYRKNFSVTKKDGELVFLIFEGICRDCTLYLNGNKIYAKQNGNMGFEVDITPYLKEENELYITVDNTPLHHGPCFSSARWYTGTGIYRHTFIDIRPKAYAKNIIVTTDVGKDSAEVHIKGELSQSADGKVRILDFNGNSVAEKDFSENLDVFLTVNEPNLWSVDAPYLYTAEITVENKTLLQKFGIRKIELTREHGVLVNGKPCFPKGFNIHHDLGVSGTAAYTSLLRHRLKLLKSIGVNALRLSHNPHAPELLDMCDEMGFLVFDECFDKLLDQYFDGFDKNWKQELTDFIMRDINHPCVYVWSVGNETAQQLYGKQAGAEYIKKIIDFAQELDPTRPVTIGQYPARKSGLRWSAPGWDDSEPSEVCTASNVCSYNYTFFFFEKDMKLFPEKVFIQSEAHVGSANLCGWEEVNRLKACGQFYWGGVEYLGESISPEYRGWARGFVDICDNKKALCYQIQAAYSEKPVVHGAVITQNDTVLWNDVCLVHNKTFDHWNWSEGEKLTVFVYTNCASALVYLNNRLVGECEKAGCCAFSKDVVYEPGELTLVGIDENGKEIARHSLITHKKPKFIKLVPTQNAKPDGNDAVAIDAYLTDENGILCQTSDLEISFTVENGYMAGCGTADLTSRMPYSSNTHKAYLGHARGVFRTESDKPLTVTVTCGNLSETAVLY